MNRTTKVLVAILALLLLLLFFFNRNKTTQYSSSIPTSDTKFAFKDTTNIQKIVLSDHQHNKVILTRKNDEQWIVNKYYPVRATSMHQLLTTIATLSMQSGVSQTALPNVNKMMEQPLKTIEIYTNADSKPAHKYYLGGLTNDRRGTYALLDGAKYPYVVQVLGHDGHVLSRFSTLEPDWRDLTVFSYQVHDIQRISLNYDNFFPNYSFTIDNSNAEQPTIVAAHPDLQTNNKIDTEKLKKYLQLYQLKYAEAYANEHPRIDSIKQSKAFCTITITNRQQQTETIPIHYMPITQRSKTQFDRNGKPMLFDQDRFFAFIHQNNDMMIVQQFNFGNIFQRYADFTIQP